ncbi:hypothetical protein [Saccharopolyspora hattusasensis]|uniref:hypothetical protein n=1 Tax=Saccharopolyspora hattusasensis TaxID=1128679 RepID=UPI003D96041E
MTDLFALYGKNAIVTGGAGHRRSHRRAARRRVREKLAFTRVTVNFSRNCADLG